MFMRKLLAVLAVVFALSALSAASCSSGSTAKKCENINDCAPCEFCNMGTCLADTACRRCKNDLDCLNGYKCNIGAGGVCELKQTSDGDQTETVEISDDNVIDNNTDDPAEDDTNVDLPTEDDQIVDNPAEEDVIDNIITPDGDDDFAADGMEFEEVGEFDFESTTLCGSSGATGPAIIIDPSSETVDFGAVDVGDYKIKYVTICNGGTAAFSITNIHLAPGTTAEFELRNDATPLTLDPGKGAVVAVIYQPRNNVNDLGKMIILSNSDRPQVEITLIGAVKKVGRLEVSPQIIQFYFQGATKLINLSNVGVIDLAVLALQIEDPNNGKFHVVDPIGAGPWELAPNAIMTASVQFDGGNNAQDAILHILWSNGEREIQTDVKLEAGGKVVCATPNAGLDQQVAPLDVVQLDGSFSFDANDAPRGNEDYYLWDFFSKPVGSPQAKLCEDVVVNAQAHTVTCTNEVTGRWSNVVRPKFFAEVAGTYVITLRINPHDDPTCAPTAKVTINAIPSETIHIQLRWAVAKNDHDLHFVRYNTPSMPNSIKPGCFSRDDGGWIYYNGNDCMYMNCNTYNGAQTPMFQPNWGDAAQTVDNPRLDIDDIQGTGPENINLSLPETGDYFVAVEYYSCTNGQTGCTNTDITVKIMIFGVLAYSKSGVKIPAYNNHWNVAWVHVNSAADIQVEEIKAAGGGPLIKGSGSNDCNPTAP